MPSALNDRPVRLAAASLSAVAGYVDAVGFLMTGGFFVSFMSGNTTRAGIGLAEQAAAGVIGACLIALFVVGVILGALVGRAAKARRRPVVLILVTALLVAAAAAASFGAVPLAIVAMVMAMGAENTVFAEEGEVKIGVTYMTGTLVKLGKKITAALMGGDRLGWAPYLLLWLGLLAGAVLGAAAYSLAGTGALWGAAAMMGLLSLVVARIAPRPVRSE